MARSRKQPPAPPPPPTPPLSGRASPQAIQKRRVARKLNDLLTGRSMAAVALDGRTQKRRQRLMSELEKSTKKGAKALKPIELIQRVNDLLDLGEPLSSVRKVAKVRPNRTVSHADAVQILRDVHAAYGFRIEAYRFLGLPPDALIEAKLTPPGAPRRGGPAKSSR